MKTKHRDPIDIRMIEAEQAFIMEHGAKPRSIGLGPEEVNEFREWWMDMERKGMITVRTGDEKARGAFPPDLYFRGMLVERGPKPGITAK